MHDPQQAAAAAPAPGTAGHGSWAESRAPVSRRRSAPLRPIQGYGHTHVQTPVCGYTCPQTCRSPSTHTTHTGAGPPPSTGPHVAGTPGQCRELPWEPGPASWVSRRLWSSPALISQALRIKDFQEGMIMVPGFSPAGSEAQALSKGGSMKGS